MDRVVIQFVLDTSADQEAIDAACRTLGSEVARCVGEVTGRTTKFVDTPPAIIVADLGKAAPRQEQMRIKLPLPKRPHAVDVQAVEQGHRHQPAHPVHPCAAQQDSAHPPRATDCSL
jgi:hypothetical protein